MVHPKMKIIQSFRGTQWKADGFSCILMKCCIDGLYGGFLVQFFICRIKQEQQPLFKELVTMLVWWYPFTSVV